MQKINLRRNNSTGTPLMDTDTKEFWEGKSWPQLIHVPTYPCLTTLLHEMVSWSTRTTDEFEETKRERKREGVYAVQPEPPCWVGRGCSMRCWPWSAIHIHSCWRSTAQTFTLFSNVHSVIKWWIEMRMQLRTSVKSWFTLVCMMSTDYHLSK